MKNPFEFKLNRKQKRIIKGVLTDVDVELISLCFGDMNPVNKKGFIAKGENGKDVKNIGSSGKKVTFEKGDKEGRLFVTIMEPGVKDSQGDSFSAEEVKKAQTAFSKKGLVGKHDVNHNLQTVKDVFMAESYILKAEDKKHFPDTAQGSWVGVLQVEDLQSELWKAVEDGKFNGVSIYGKAVDNGNPDMEAVKSQLSGIQKAITELAKADGEAAKTQVKELQKQLEELQKSLEGKDDNNADMKDVMKGIKDILADLKKGINITIKAEPEGKSVEEDRKFTLPDGKEVIIKAQKKELYKALADVYAGNRLGILTQNETKGFMDAIIGMGGDLLADFSMLPISKAGTVDTGLLADVIMYNHSDTAILGTAATGDLTIGAQILHTGTTLAKATLEYYKDSCGGDELAYGAFIEQALAMKIRKAIKGIVFAGKRNANGGANVSAMDGVIEKATDAAAVTTITVDDKDDPGVVSLFTQVLAEFDEAILEDPANFKIYVPLAMFLKIQAQYANRNTALGDQITMNGGKMYYAGYEIKMAPMQSNYYVCAGISKMVVIGYINDAEIKIEHSGLTFDYTIYTRSNWGVNYVDPKFQVFLITS